MLMSDFFPRLNRAVKTMPDKRVTHYWDKEKTVGKWMKKFATPEYKGAILWDAALLYGPDDVWTDSLPPYAFYGRTIIQDADELKKSFQKMTKNENGS